MKEKLNVLFMVSWYREKDGNDGGIFHYEQVKSLNEFCNCAIYMPYDKTLETFFSNDIEDGIKTFRSKYALENKIRNRVYMIRAMSRIIKEFHPDIIHGNVGTEAGRFAVALGKLFRIPVIVTEHSTTELSGVTSFPHYWYAKFAYENSDYNACVSDKLTENLGKIFPKCTFHTVYNGISTIDSNSLDKNKHYRVENCINIVMVAGFYDKEIKGFHIVFPVLKRLLEENISVVLHLVGGGEYLEYYKEQAKELHIEKQCVFYGSCPKEKVYAIVNDMDFLVSASLYESFGCSVAEALMLGKPAVVTKCGGPESIVNNQTGILVDVNNEDALYTGIKKMIEQYDEYSPSMLKQYAADKFDIRQISKKYLQIYRGILEDKNKKKR